MKRCSKCKKEKAVELFARSRREKDGLQPYCKPCQAAYQKSNPPKYNHEKYLSRYSANREKELAASKERYAKNIAFRERKKQQAREWSKANPDARAAIRARWAEEHREQARQSNLAGAHVRRARAAGVECEGRILPSTIFARDNGICGICHEPVTADQRPSMDHIIPLAAGGPHTLANIQLAHLSCNAKKRDRIDG